MIYRIYLLFPHQFLGMNFLTLLGFLRSLWQTSLGTLLHTWTGWRLGMNLGTWLHIFWGTKSHLSLGTSTVILKRRLHSIICNYIYQLR